MNAQAPTHDPAGLGYRVVFGWGLGSLGLAVILNTLNVLLIAYLTLVVGLEPALAGSLVLVAKIYDVLTDLPMGWLSDRTRSRWGARRPYLLAAGVVTPLAIFMLFATPAGAGVPYVTIALLLYATGYTLFNVPYLSMPAELTTNVHVRTRMVAYRSSFIAAGTFFGIAVAPYLVGSLGGGAHGYAVLGVVMAVLIAAAFVGCCVMTGAARPAEPGRTFEPVREQLAVIFADGHFVTLILIKVTHLLAVAISAGTLVFFFRFALEYDMRLLGVYGAVTTAVWALAMPLWSRLARAKGKRFGYFVATAANALLHLTWLLAQPGEPLPLLLARAVGFGLISGGMLLMGNAMLQDVMDLDYRETGRRKNGMFAGIYSLVEKITSGIGAQVLGLVLSATGFDRLAATQSDAATNGIFVMVALIPALLMALSLAAIRRYRLDESRLHAPPIRAPLKEADP
jgi:GPH family glycoside/pentoside/hexuronide:cation symporter